MSEGGSAVGGFGHVDLQDGVLHGSADCVLTNATRPSAHELYSYNRSADRSRITCKFGTTRNTCLTRSFQIVSFASPHF